MAYFASGFYVVNADEHAVVRRFGVGGNHRWNIEEIELEAV